jgi:hypothetical protein
MIAEAQFTVEDFRNRIQAMTDEKLFQMGKARDTSLTRANQPTSAPSDLFT